MRRRELLLIGSGLAVQRTWAEHGWKPFPDRPPIYLEGEVTQILWSDPHPHLELAQRRDAPIPKDLARALLRHRDEAASATLLRTVLPAPIAEGIWRVELVTGSPVMLAQLLFVGSKGYPLRADPL